MAGKYDVAGAERLWANQEGRGRSGSIPLLSFTQSDISVGLSRRKSSIASIVPSNSAQLDAKPDFLTKLRNMMPDSSLLKLRFSLILFLFDWLVDMGSGLYYFCTGRWIQGTLTFIVVFGAGIGITVGFLVDTETRRWLDRASRRHGWTSVFLLYTPTFFPFFTGLMRLRSEVTWLKAGDELRMMETDEVVKWRTLCFKANWTETVFEAKPQLLLQLILLLETTATFTNPLDYLPVLTSALSLYTVTNTIYTLVETETKDETPLWSWLWGMSYTAVSVGGPAMVANIVRSRFEAEGHKFLATLVCIPLYFLLFESIYMICYGVWRLDMKKRRFSQIYYIVLPLIYLGCLGGWIWLGDLETVGRVRIYIMPLLFISALLINVIAFWLAQDFAETSFRLKNDKIDGHFKSRDQTAVIAKDNDNGATPVA